MNKIKKEHSYGILAIVALVAIIAIFTILKPSFSLQTSTEEDLVGEAQSPVKQRLTKAKESAANNKILTTPQEERIAAIPGGMNEGDSIFPPGINPGDSNQDYAVNALDLVNIVNSFGEEPNELNPGDLTYILIGTNIGLDLYDAIWVKDCILEFASDCDSMGPGCMNSESEDYNPSANYNCCCDPTFISFSSFFPNNNVCPNSTLEFFFQIYINFNADNAPPGVNIESFSESYSEGIDEEIISSIEMIGDLGDLDNSGVIELIEIYPIDSTTTTFRYKYYSPEVTESVEGQIQIGLLFDIGGMMAEDTFLTENIKVDPLMNCGDIVQGGDDGDGGSSG